MRLITGNMGKIQQKPSTRQQTVDVSDVSAICKKDEHCSPDQNNNNSRKMRRRKITRRRSAFIKYARQTEHSFTHFHGQGRRIGSDKGWRSTTLETTATRNARPHRRIIDSARYVALVCFSIVRQPMFAGERF
jgi:hypothetical protein